jgi:hypothetical protein
VTRLSLGTGNRTLFGLSIALMTKQVSITRITALSELRAASASLNDGEYGEGFSSTDAS